MIITTAGIVTLPCLTLAWALGSYLFVLTTRLAFCRVSSVNQTRLYLAIKELADPLPRYVEERLVARLRRRDPAWVSWLCVILGAWLCEQMLMWIAVSLG